MIRLRPSGADEVLIKRVRDWYEPGPGVFIAPQALFNPALLFTTGVNGTWYDPSDLTTLFQDAAGTTPVTAVEQPVGLMLDKSKGLVLGPELVTNGDFSNGTTGWTAANASLSVVGGALNMSVNNTGTYLTEITALIPTIAGRSYSITGQLSRTSGSGLVYFVAASAAYAPLAESAKVSSSSLTPVSAIFTAVGSTTRVAIVRSTSVASGEVYQADNISVRELPGNHAFNSSGNSANFPVLSARYNLLTKTEQFDDASWAKSAAIISANTTTAPDGTLTADSFIETTAATAAHSFESGSYSPGTYTVSLYAKPLGVGATRYLCLTLNEGGTGPTNFVTAVFDLVAGTVTGTNAVGGTTYISSSCVAAANGFYRCTLTGTLPATFTVLLSLSNVSTAPASAYGRNIYTGDGTSGIYIWGADLRVSNDALNQPAYQRVNTATDYDTAGFKPYLKFNGTNQWLQTNSIDFSYGDKMFVCAGVRKLSAVGTQMISELSIDAGINNGFYIADVGSDIYSKLGTPDSLASFPFSTSPVSGVVSCVYDKTKTTTLTSILARIDGAPVAGVTITEADALGNFSNYPLYIGARGGTSLWFNGRLHQLIVAGKQASASEIGQTEAFVNQKTGAY